MTRLTKEGRKDGMGMEEAEDRLGGGGGEGGGRAEAAVKQSPVPQPAVAAAAAGTVMGKEEARKVEGEWVEPICRNDPSRFVLFPMKHPDLWEMYKRHEASFWTAEEVDLSQDMGDWQVRREGGKEGGKEEGREGGKEGRREGGQGLQALKRRRKTPLTLSAERNSSSPPPSVRPVPCRD